MASHRLKSNQLLRYPELTIIACRDGAREMDKAAILEELTNNTYVILRPSPVAGIGVFALVDIPRGCRSMFTKPGNDEWVAIDRTEIDALPPHARHLVENYCLFDDSKYYVPAQGFKVLDLSLFINHADTPNLTSVNDGEYFEALREIKAGEELFLDYGAIVHE